MYKNNRYIEALQGETMDRPPVWMMRQAGRFLPEFRALREKYDFFTRCQTPELASEITLMPIERYPLDAAILFSDILVIPQAMGLPFEMKPGIGPFLENKITDKKQIDHLQDSDISPLQYVFDAIDLTVQKLDNTIPLIGFAGSPWTILCYCVEGRGSKDFSTAKGFCFKNPEWADELLQKITNLTILYLKEKVKHGVASVQLFDSWGGLLSFSDYERYSWKYLQQIVDALSPLTNVIVFGKGCWHSLDKMANSGAKAVGVDWTISPKQARDWTANSVTLQGNFDPSKLLGNPDDIYKEAQQMIREFGPTKYIANLGHGILPSVPLANAEAFIEAVVDFGG